MRAGRRWLLYSWIFYIFLIKAGKFPIILIFMIGGGQGTHSFSKNLISSLALSYSVWLLDGDETKYSDINLVSNIFWRIHISRLHVPQLIPVLADGIRTERMARNSTLNSWKRYYVWYPVQTAIFYLRSKLMSPCGHGRKLWPLSDFSCDWFQVSCCRRRKNTFSFELLCMEIRFSFEILLKTAKKIRLRRKIISL